MSMDPIHMRLRIYMVIFFIVMIIGTLGFMILEGFSLSDALYFGIVTIATVGYGDIHPATQAGKILAIFLIITGVGTFLGAIANAAELMLTKREKKARLEKLTMVIGTFFSEVGTRLLTICSDDDPNVDQIRQDLIVTGRWTDKEFTAVSKRVKSYTCTIDMKRVDLRELSEFLVAKRDFLLRLLENPTLMEHGVFTKLLYAVFHLTEELDFREDVGELPDTDRAHLRGDIERAYRLLIDQWIEYMRYLKDKYPYLFSLAMRTNPFDRTTSPVVRE